MAFDSFGAPQFGLADAKIAPWAATNSYGAAVDVMSVQALSVNLNMVSATLTGDDSETANASRSVSADITLRFGAIGIAAMEVLIGNTATSSVASPNVVKQLKVAGGDNMPYFGLCGQAYAEEGIGDFLMFMPKCKIMGNVRLAQMEYGQFVIPELPVKAVADATYGILNMIERQTAGTVTIPPANIT